MTAEKSTRRSFLRIVGPLTFAGLAGCAGSGGSGSSGATETATPSSESTTMSNQDTATESPTPTKTPTPSGSNMNFLDGEIDINVSPSVPQDRLEDQYAPIRDYLSKRFDLSAKMNIAKNYSVVIQALGAGTSDIAETGPFAAALGVKAEKADIILQRKGYGSWTYKSTIRARANSDMNSLSDLADMDNPTIAFADRLSTSGTLYPLRELKNAGLNIGNLPEGNGSDAGFKPVFTGGHTASYETLVNNQADAAAMGGFVKEKKVKMLKVVSGLPRAPIVVSPKLSDQTKDALVKAFTEAPASIYYGEDGKSDTDDDLWFTGVREASVEDYQDVIDVANQLGVGTDFFQNV